MSASYDIIIGGSGVAGLRVATELLRKNRHLRIAILEKAATAGGRARTFKDSKQGLQWEAGAGRISSEHHRVQGLLKRYKLTWSPIGATINYKDTYDTPLESNVFEPGIPALLDPLAGLPEEVLATHTLRQLLTKTHGPVLTENYLIRFPYRAEVDVMRADLALKLFRGEMRQHEGYGICPEGLSAMTAAMLKDAVKRGAEFFPEHEIVGWTGGADGAKLQVEIRCGPASEGTARPLKVISAQHLVLAIPAAQAKTLPPLSSCKGLKHLTMTPLLRFYAVFPRDPLTKKRWYEDFPGRIVTSTPIRYLIGGNPATGSCQISYTDTQDAAYWIERLEARGEKAVCEEMLGELRRLLLPTIPPPTFYAAHPWKEGVTYWLPGRYDPVAASAAALQPLGDASPCVHLCGESYSLRQGWMEGALEHADQLVRLLEKSDAMKR